jgi:AraC-like DNA-binding protein
MDKEISHLLQEVRLWTEWSEPRIARALGVSQPTVHRILNGQSECRGSTLLAITELHARMAQREAARLQAVSSAALGSALAGALTGAMPAEGGFGGA